MRFLLRFLLALLGSAILFAVASAQDAGLVVQEPIIPPGFNPYKVLGVPRGSSAGAIKRGARTKHKSNANIQEVTLRKVQDDLVNLAFTTLTDSNKRERWEKENPVPSAGEPTPLPEGHTDDEL